MVTTLASLLPRLTLDRAGEDDYFRGTLGGASFAIELGRLRSLIADPATPSDLATELEQYLSKLAPALQALGGSRASELQAHIAAIEQITADERTRLAARQLEPGTTLARATLRAGASLRFIADRFVIDRAYYERRFAEN